MKLFSTLLLACFFLFSCSNNSKKNTSDEETASDIKVVQSENSAPQQDVNSQDTSSTSKFANISFEEESFDFGQINEGDIVEHLFKFTNTGEVPLLITDTRVTCGCTTPNYTQEPILPGEQGEIMVKFNSTGKQGQQNKMIVVVANVPDGQSIIGIRTFVKAKAK